MPQKHVVKQGEGLSSIAFEYGFFPDTVWDDPANAELKAKRENPNILAEGDELTIPDKTEKTVDIETGKTHRFQLRNVPAMLRLQVFVGDEPRANQPFELTIDEVKTFKGTTDKDAVLEVGLMPDAKRGVLVVGPDDHTFEINIGEVDPHDTLRGVQARLNNLGYDCGEANGVENDATRDAILTFQRRAGLTENGNWQDPDFMKELTERHDSAQEPPSGEAAPESSEGEAEQSAPE